MTAPVIVVGVDGSRGAAGALAAAAQLARATRHQIVAVHVEHIPAAVLTAPAAGGAGDVVAAIDEAAGHCHLECELALVGSDVEWSFEVRGGDPATELVAAGRDHEAACVVVGRRGHSRMARLLVGSVTDRLVHHADRPVLVVPLPPS